MWIRDADERRRLATYAVTLGGGTALGFLAFASNANRLPVCDALSPVWLSNALLGSALLLGLQASRLEHRERQQQDRRNSGKRHRASLSG